MYRLMSIEVSFHTCFKISLSSNSVDSQSFASEKGVILILSSLMSKSGLELVLPGVIMLVLVGVLSKRETGCVLLRCKEDGVEVIQEDQPTVFRDMWLGRRRLCCHDEVSCE